MRVKFTGNSFVFEPAPPRGAYWILLWWEMEGSTRWYGKVDQGWCAVSLGPIDWRVT